MTDQGIRDYIATLRTQYPSARKVTREELVILIKSLRTAFKDYQDDQVRAALAEWIRSEKFQPTPAEVIGIVEKMREIEQGFQGMRTFWDDGCLMAYNPQTQLYEVVKRIPPDKSKWSAAGWEIFRIGERTVAEKEARKRAEQFEPTQVELDDIELDDIEEDDDE